MNDNQFNYAIFEQGAINSDRLHEELQAALGEAYDSVDTGVAIPGRSGAFILVRIWKNKTNDQQLGQIEAVLKKHDPAQLSKQQQKEQDRIDAFIRLRDTDFKALRNLSAAPASGRGAKPEAAETTITRTEFEALKAQMGAVIDLLEDWQKLMEQPHG